MQDKRKSVRRSFERPGWIVLGGGSQPISCTFRDMSKSGARLRVEPEQSIPPSFVLHLASNGAVARKCVVVWRSEAGDDLGVEFVARRVAPSAKPPLAMSA